MTKFDKYTESFRKMNESIKPETEYEWNVFKDSVKRILNFIEHTPEIELNPEELKLTIKNQKAYLVLTEEFERIDEEYKQPIELLS